MEPLAWIVLGGILMSAIAMVGSVTLLLEPATLDRILLPLVAFSAGSLIGGAFFHMIPAAFDAGVNGLDVGIAVVMGFTVFFMLEQSRSPQHFRRFNDKRFNIHFPFSLFRNFVPNIRIVYKEYNKRIQQN